MTKVGDALLKGRRRITLTTSGTFTAPVTGCYKVVVIGGGGGGGGCSTSSGSVGSAAGGGGGGGWAEFYVNLTAGQQVSYTVGAGGAAAVPTGYGGNGGDSWFGSYASASGGSGGENASDTRPAASGQKGGSGNLIDNTITGTIGKGTSGAHASLSAGGNPPLIRPGFGGASYFGGGAWAGTSTNAGTAGTLAGEGGSGGCITGVYGGVAGGAGAAGAIVIDCQES